MVIGWEYMECKNHLFKNNFSKGTLQAQNTAALQAIIKYVVLYFSGTDLHQVEKKLSFLSKNEDEKPLSVV